MFPSAFASLRSKFTCALLTGLAIAAGPGAMQMQAQGSSCAQPTKGADGIYRGTCLEGSYTVIGPTVITGLTHVPAGAVLQFGDGSVEFGGSAENPPQGGYPKSSAYLETGSLQVDKGGVVSADGAGFANRGATQAGPPPPPPCETYIDLGGAGPGAASGAHGISGGSYGGAGGNLNGNTTDAAYEYGTVRQPADYGSSGWTSATAWSQAAGGGTIRLIVDGSMIFNGVMEANGLLNSVLKGCNPPDNYNGGSGGSIWVTTNSLSGSGSFYAAGGWASQDPEIPNDPSAGPGGGGRIWVEYQDGSGYTGFGTNSSDDGATFAGSPAYSHGATHGSLAFAIPGSTNADPYGLVVDKYYTIPANTNITYTSLTVLTGGVLAIGGGSTINVTGAFNVTGNSQVILQSINTSAQVNGAWAGQGSVINAGSMQVDAGSSISADGLGYMQEAGPGAAAGPGSTAGGSYGGAGGRLSNDPTTIAPTYEYGSANMPTQLGSGGWEYASAGGTGGGLVQIAVSGATVMNGSISANGTKGGYNSAGGGAGSGGGGSGGSIYLTTGTLAGNGTFSAIGGDAGISGAGSGGGGRIFVESESGSTFTNENEATTAPGAGTNYVGSVGTIAFVDKSGDTGGNAGSQGALMVDEPYTIPAGTKATYDSISVMHGTTLTIGGGSTLTITGNVNVAGNSQILLQSINNTAQVNGKWAGQGSTLTAGSVNVDAGSSINADGSGYAIEAGPGATPGQYSTTGGSYGGIGGNGPRNPDGSRSTAFEYGSPTQPSDLGSGGWAYGGTAGAGGGAVLMTVSGALTLNGTISANGQSSSNSGAGSGGSIYVTAASVSGGGAFLANGGNGYNSQGAAAGGGGGRVAVYANSTAGFTGYTGSTGSGGTSDDTTPAQRTQLTGSTGTIAFFDTSTSTPSVTTYQRFTFPASATTSYTNITATNGATLVVGGGATVNVSGTLLATGNSTVQVQSINNTAQVNDAWVGQGSTFNAANVQVDAGSTMSANSQGYIAEAGPGATIGCGSTTGGSYGGRGGRITCDGSINNGFEYGSESAPVDLGSGGWTYGGTVGAGGGAIHLNVSGTMTLNGTVTANGGAATGYAGGGSGGSVYTTAAKLAGSGTFQANGGTSSGDGGASAGGGGGRIAVYSATLTSFTGAAGSSVNGGTGGGNSNLPGSIGTLAFFDTSVPNNNVGIYGNYVIPANTTEQFNNLTVASGGSLEMGGGSQLIMVQNLDVAGTIIAHAVNTSGEVNGKWQGKGITVLAATATVESTGVLTADGQGYPAETGPGAEPGPGSTAGGTYGGLGGRTDSSVTTYGSVTMPMDLGSGGWQYGGTGGAGGGAIELLTSGTLTNNGVITANGVNPTNSAGGGAGGSVFLAANTINGTGAITANGGTLPSGGGAGGGGGRVSLLYVNAGSFANTSISAAGGMSDQNGANGTINFVQQSYSQWILPAQPAIHDIAQLAWFTDAGGTTAVFLGGPRTQQIATGSGAFSSTNFDTTQFPDGAYQLRLTVYDAKGNDVGELIKPEAINNSVLWHSGTLTANQEWTAGRVHAIDGDVIVPAGITLTIDPGAIVKALPGVQILVLPGGTLNALGTAAAPIIFTTFDDPTYGGDTDFNQGTSIPTAGEWLGIITQGTGTANLNGYTTLYYVQASLSGTLGSNESLLGTQVYVITGTLTVPDGVTLSVQPGAVVKFGEGAGIDVQKGGTLNAVGTVTQPIYFTSLNDSSIGGNQSGYSPTITPVAGDWNSIEIDGGTATFNHAHIFYGGGPQNSSAQAGMIETGNTANVAITNSELAYAFFIGLQTGYPNGGGDTVTVTNTIFHTNEDRAINTYSGSTVHVVNDTFDSNAAGVFNHGGTVDIENSVVTNSSNSQFGGIGICCGGTYSNLSYNDSYTTVSGVPNYVGLTDPTGSNGNISAAPVYMNAPLYDYRPTYGSPLIDAADGTVAAYPAADSFNDPRYNSPLVTNKTGKPDANGKYPDIGAFEFVQTATSDLDLTATNVHGPTSAIVGTQVTLTWTDTNIGQGTVTGPWHDAVYLISGNGSNAAPVFAGNVLVGQGITLGPGASTQISGTVTVPGTMVGNQRWEIQVNALGEVLEGANTANNTSDSLDTVAVDLQQLVAGDSALSGSFAGDDQTAYYKVVPSPTQTTEVQLALNGTGGGAVELFVGSNYVPTPQHYDYTQTQFNASTVSVVIPAGAQQTYYVAAYAQDLTSAPAGYNIDATSVSFSLTSVTPSTVPNAGDHTFTFIGGGFASSTTFSLVDAVGDVITPTAVYIADATHADVTFHFNYAVGSGVITKQGTYDATATNGTQTLTLPGAVQVLSQISSPLTAAVGTLQINLAVPQAFRAGFPAIITVNYTNISGYDTPAPLMYVNATNATLAEVPPNCSTCSANYASQYQNTFASGLVLAISAQGPAGILPSGGSGSIQFLATPTGTSGTVSFAATEAIGDVVGTQLYEETVDYSCPLGNTCTQPPAPQYFGYPAGGYATAAALCSSLAPAGQSAVGATRACMQMLNSAGYTYTAPQSGITVQSGICSSTYGINCLPVNGSDGGIAYVYGHLTAKQLSALLAADATALSAQGDYVYDVQKLLAFELDKDGLSDFNQRTHLGSLGYGFINQFDIKLTGSAGSLTETLSDGSPRVFNTPSSTAPNVWLGDATDRATATQLADGSWNIADPKVGQTLHFVAGQDGYLLSSAQGPGTYSLQTMYAGNVMTGASDNLGNSLVLQHDAQGHITQSVDGMGNKRTFTYTLLNDASNSAFLISAVTPAGTYTYQWSTGGSDGVGYIDDSCIPTYCEPAIGILREAFPDSTHLNYTYNAAGRLVAESKDNNAELTTFAYGANGAITMTDGSGVSTTVTPGANGIAEITDSLGNEHHFKFDAESNLIGAIGALGGSSSFTYDANGNLSGTTRPGGSHTGLTYNVNGLPATLTDPLNGTFAFGYDSGGNMTSLKDPSGQGFTFTYDANGNMLTRTNRRGQTTTYTYTASGPLASVTLSTGAKTTYTYDSRNNLLNVTGPAGIIQYTYDSQNRITAIANPDGTQLTYTYNANGQRSSITDSTGFTVNSTYDTAGRLSGLTGSNGAAIVTYTYDGAGKVSTQAMGNGTSSAYTYDGNGKVASVVHKSASGALLGEYDYTYDANLQMLTENTPAGTNTLQYDLDGQVTSDTTPAGQLQYVYDSNGNRTSVSVNGAPTNYAPNNLNEYTTVGDAAYLYDADGNLISGNGYTYTYDENNQLISAAGPNDTWSYTYDALGNRISATHNGTTTRYLIDPSGYGNVIATLNGDGTVQSHYIYGLGLTSVVPAGTAANYYAFDARGNTVAITGPSGTAINSYSYLPFGEKAVSAAGVSNIFTYNGMYGVTDDGPGLYGMRHRVYSPALGRFLQQDPTLFRGRDTNLYRYVGNNPMALSDPCGECWKAYDFFSHGLNAFGGFIPGAAGVAAGVVGVGTSVPGAVSSDGSFSSDNIHDATILGNGITGTTAGAVSLVSSAGGGTALAAVADTVVTGGAVAGLVDEGSQLLFEQFGNAYYYQPGANGPLLFAPTDAQVWHMDDCPPEQPVPPDTPPIPPPPTINIPHNPNDPVISFVAKAIDPNGKLTSGFGDNGYVPAGAAITYTVYFENQPTATAAAQKVTVTDSLSSNLDWSTVQLTNIAFNNATLSIPAGVQTYNGQAAVSTDSNPVNINAALNPTTGVLTWTMQSVDPVTGATPANPLAGFLPPNNSSNAGVGSVTFTVKPKTNLANAATVMNQASIVFDVNAPIATNTVTNTLDTTSPTSSIASLPSTSGTSFNVSWTGSDPSGSGIATYNIYNAMDDGQYMLWQSATTATSATFTGLAGHSYSFISLATNNVGTVQTTASAAVTTNVASTGLAAVTLTVTPASSSIAQNQALSVTVAASSTGTPTGSIVLLGGGYTSAGSTLNSGTATITIPAGSLSVGTDTLTATYTPDTASASIYSGATGTAQVTVSAPAAPAVTVAPGAISFTAVATTTSAAQTVTLTNTGNAALSISSISLTGTAANAFAQTNTCGNSVAVGVSCTISVTFTPATAASYTAALSIADNAGNSPQSVTLTGTGTAATAPTAPVVKLSSSALTFTAIANTTSAAQIVTLTNSGNVDLAISGITLGGANTNLFAETTTCGTTLSAGASCTLSVTFSPTATGSFAATIAVADNATGAPHTIALSGTGTPLPSFTLSLSPQSQTVTRGSNASYSVTVTPQNGSFTNPVSFAISGLPGSYVASFSSTSVTPGASATSVTLTVRTSNMASMAPPARPGYGNTAPVLTASGLLLLLAGKRRRRWVIQLLLIISVGLIVGSVTGCGTEPPTYKFTVTATGAGIGTSSAISQTAAGQIIVK